MHAADGYARSTGKVGVALVTSGPGVTNAVTGIATAYMDSIPLVIITGQVPTHAIGQDAFQEVDTVGITRPCVKHNFLVKDVKDLAVTMKKAFYIAATGRPGPVVVDIPKDVQTAKTAFFYPQSVSMRSYNPVIKGHGGQIKKAIQLLLEAKRPMIYTGGGLILGNASAELTQLVRALGFPCTNTLMGLGGYPATDPQFVGMLGMHGTYEANMAMQTLRRAARDRRAFRRSRDRQPEAFLRGEAQDHPHRHRPVVDLQARQGGRADRRQRAEVLQEMNRSLPPRKRAPGSGRCQGVVGADRAVARPRLPEVRPHQRDHQAAVRDREAVRGDQGRWTLS